MPIKNYSSTISPRDSIGKIQSLLAEHNARKIQIEYEGGKPSALGFSMDVGEHEMYFRLTVDVEGMLLAMDDDPKVSKKYVNLDQAERTAWKNKYEWLHIQLAEIQSNQARMQQLLLGYAITEDGRTVYERLQDNNRLLTNTSVNH